MTSFAKTLLLTASALLFVPLAACNEHKAVHAVSSPQLGERMVVSVQTVDDLKPLSGAYTNRYLTDTVARITGVLTSISVKEGDFVKKGQVIGFVHDQKINYQTSAYDSSIAAAQAQLDVAEANLKRTQTLYDKGIIALAKLEIDQASARAARAQYEAARAQKAASAELGNQGALIAPSEGRVLKINAPQGSVVVMGTPVVSLTSGETVIRVDVPQGQTQAIASGQRLPLEIHGQALTGTVTQVYPSITNGQIVADITPDTQGSYIVGERVTAWIKVGQRQAIVVPKRFLVTRYGIDYITLVAKDGAVMDTPVQITPYGIDQIEVLSGLNSGDTIAIKTPVAAQPAKGTK